MQKERLIINNFFTLKDINIDLSKYNVFIGEQASGKSLISKLLFYFRSISLASIKLYRTDLKELQENFIHVFCNSLNINDFNLNAIIKYQVNNYEIIIHIADERVAIEYNQDLTNLYNEKRQLLLKKYEETQKSQISEDAINFAIMELEVNRAIESSTLGNITLSRFLPAGRVAFFTLLNNLFNVISNDTLNLNQFMINFGKDYQDAFSKYNNYTNDFKDRLVKFNEFSDKILKGKYIYDKLGGYIQHDGFQTKLADGSSGQQEFIPVYMILRYYLLSGFEHGHLFIEEPEAHLYPAAQKAITELLVYITNATNSDGLYITTHSPYILTVLNNLILAYDVKDKQTLFDKDLLVPFEDVRAYYIADGSAHDLRDMENRLIMGDNLDKISEQTAIDFDHLLDLKYE